MGHTTRLWCSNPDVYKQIQEEGLREIREKINRPDPAFAKKMKDKGYPSETVCEVCNITPEEFNNL